MNVIFYSTHCPRCKVLETKLKQKEIAYIEENDVQKMLNLGLHTAPALQVGEEIMDFTNAVKWINSQDMEDR